MRSKRNDWRSRYSRSRPHEVVEVDRAAPLHLRPPGHALGRRESEEVAGRVQLDLVGQRRARPHEAHVALQHVPQLRELVEAERTQHAAGARHPRVGTGSERLAVAPVGPHRREPAPIRADVRGDVLPVDARVGVADHRPELQQRERLERPAVAVAASTADPLPDGRSRVRRCRSGSRDRRGGTPGAGAPTRCSRRRRRTPASRRSTRALHEGVVVRSWIPRNAPVDTGAPVVIDGCDHVHAWSLPPAGDGTTGGNASDPSDVVARLRRTTDFRRR